MFRQVVSPPQSSSIVVPLPSTSTGSTYTCACVTKYPRTHHEGSRWRGFVTKFVLSVRMYERAYFLLRVCGCAFACVHAVARLCVRLCVRSYVSVPVRPNQRRLLRSVGRCVLQSSVSLRFPQGTDSPPPVRTTSEKIRETS